MCVYVHAAWLKCGKAIVGIAGLFIPKHTPPPSPPSPTDVYGSIRGQRAYEVIDLVAGGCCIVR